ncbi:hypothetical protein wNi1_09970 [Wolbachia pipientis]
MTFKFITTLCKLILQYGGYMEANMQPQESTKEEIKKYEDITEASLSLGSTSYKGTVEQSAS